MKLLGLPFVLRVVGVSVLLLVAFQYIVLGAFLVPAPCYCMLLSSAFHLLRKACRVWSLASHY